MRRAFDSIRVVEAAYRIGASDTEWIEAISEAAQPGMDQGLGVASVYWRVGSDGVLPRIVAGPVADDQRAFIPLTYGRLPSDFVGRAFSGPPWASRISDLPAIHALLLQDAARHGHPVGDVVAAQVGDGRGRGITIGAMASRRGSLAAHRQRTWVRIMAHVGAAVRLRGRVEDGVPSSREAVFDPSGRLCHAESELRHDRAGREALRDAVRRIEGARGRMRRVDADEALATWTALVEGTWSVVDWVDTDGRRYLVAHENRLCTPDPRALSARA